MPNAGRDTEYMELSYTATGVDQLLRKIETIY